MKTHKTLIIIIMAAVAVLPSVAYPLFMPADSEVESLVRLYARAGRVFPDASYPLSKADLDEFAARLLDSVSGDARLPGSRRAQVQAEVRSYRGGLGYRAGRQYLAADSALEATGLLQGSPWLEEAEAQAAGEDRGANDFTRYPNDLHTRFVEFPDMAQLALMAGNEGHSGMHISAGIKREYRPDHLPVSNLFFLDRDADALIENYMIRSGYIAWRSDHFEARFGRAPVHYGDARFSSFLPSKNLPWLDTFSYRYRIGPLTMSSYFGTLENRVSDDEAALFGIDGGSGSYFFDTEKRNVGFTPDGELVLDPKGDPVGDSLQMAFAETTILSSMHRFVLAAEKLRFAITAHSVVARERNALVIGDVFPVFSWHNGFVGHHNMHMVFEASYLPLPGLVLYGQAAYDDINAGDLIGIPDSSIPTIGAHLGGVAWEGSGFQGRRLSAKLEAGRTHYLWGNYYAYHPEKGGYFERAIYRYNTQNGLYWMPLTSPYGPGVVWIDGQAKLGLPEQIELSFGAKYLSINSAADLLALTYERNDALEDAPRISSYSIWARLERRFVLKGSTASDRFDALRLRATPVLYSYDGHLWPEIEFSIRFEAARRGTLKE